MDQPFGSDHPEFGQVPAERVDGLGALANQQVPRAEHDGGGLLVRTLEGNKAHRRYVRSSEGLVRPNLRTHELTRVARAGRAEPHAKEDGPWTTIASLTSASIRPRPSTPWPSRRAAERERCVISARSKQRRLRLSASWVSWRTSTRPCTSAMRPAQPGMGFTGISEPSAIPVM